MFVINIITAILFVYVANIFYFKITSKLGEKSNNKKKVKTETGTFLANRVATLMELV